jgi:hypothetical protein
MVWVLVGQPDVRACNQIRVAQFRCQKWCPGVIGHRPLEPRICEDVVWFTSLIFTWLPLDTGTRSTDRSTAVDVETDASDEFSVGAGQVAHSGRNVGRLGHSFHRDAGDDRGLLLV